MLLEIGISLLLTIICYLIFPIIYLKTKGKVAEKKGKKLALWNSIVCATVFFVIGMAIGLQPATNGTMFAPAVLYYFISKFILIDYNMKENSFVKKIESQYIKDIKNENSTAKEDVIEKDEIAEENKKEKSKEEINNIKPLIEKTSSKINTIKNIQKIVIAISTILLLFIIIYPISSFASANAQIPAQSEYKTIKLTNLDSNQKVYCEMDGNYNYVYIKSPDEILVYRFYNATMYGSSGTVIFGKATNLELKNYFTSNIYSGKPSINYIMPAAAPIGWSLGNIMIGIIVFLLYLIHRFAEQEIFYLFKTDEIFKKIKNDFKKDEINKDTYKKLKKLNFSEKILNNNKFFKIFNILY